LSEAEKLFGEKNFNKKIYRPIFNGDRPKIINTPNLDGAFASLSTGAKTDWVSTFYELAHETVHLLDPVTGFTNYLEEGFAVMFSLDMLKIHLNDNQFPQCSFYQKAWQLVNRLDGYPFPDCNPYDAAKLIRYKFGSLGEVEISGMFEIFPRVPKDIIQKLCDECNFT
tara:strand:- start:433 stop:936 length:504 start_codon:yes stop_codon:yes gene_type:complete